MTDPCYPNFGDDYSFIFNNASYFEDFIVGYRQEAGCTNHSSVRHFLVWMRGRKTFYTAAGVPLYNLENSGDMTYKNDAGTITMTLSPQGDIYHARHMTTDGNTLLKGKLNVRDVTTFEIPHPTAPGTFLNHGALQSREHALYVRGKTTSSAIVLPPTWEHLIDMTTVTVHLTPQGPIASPGVSYDPSTETVTISPVLNTPAVSSVSQVDGVWKVLLYNPLSVNCHYLIIGKRKDVPDA